MRITVNGRAGRQYFLEAKYMLAELTWNLVTASRVLDTDQSLTLSDNSIRTSQWLYRVAVSP